MMKYVILNIYKLINTLNIFILIFVSKQKNKSPVLFVNGARSGSKGGPKVKIQRLISLFDISRYGSNIFYCLSNCIYSYNLFVKCFVKYRMPIIYNQNGVFHKSWYEGNISNKNNKMKFYLKYSDYVFYQSEFCKKCCDQIIYKRAKDFKILYNAVDTKVFIPGYVNTTKDISILKVGIYNKKNMWRLIEVIKALKKINEVNHYKYTLSIVGPICKNIRFDIDELINKCNLKNEIFILGKVEQSNMIKIMQRHQLFLSTKIHDPCSNAIIEAMACGLPIIYHNSGGNVELVDNAGWSFGIKNDKIEKVDINNIDIFRIFKKIKSSEISIKSKLARIRAENNFDITKWEFEHKKIFLHYLKKIESNNK